MSKYKTQIENALTSTYLHIWNHQTKTDSILSRERTNKAGSIRSEELEHLEQYTWKVDEAIRKIAERQRTIGAYCAHRWKGQENRD